MASKIRATLHLGGEPKSLQLYPVLQETDDHLRLKLAAVVFFHEVDPLVITSPQQHTALSNQDFAPDLMTVDYTNQVTLWVECGKTTSNKLDKVAKKFRAARIVMLLAAPHEAKQMAETVATLGHDRIEVWCFQQGEFDRWRALISDQTDIIGEATPTSMNLVVNDAMFMTELTRISPLPG